MTTATMPGTVMPCRKRQKMSWRQRSGGGGQQRGHGDAEQRGHDDALARQPLSERAKDGRRQGHAQRGGGDRHAHAGLRGMEEAGQQGQQRLGAIELEKGADAAESNGGRSPAGWAPDGLIGIGAPRTRITGFAAGSLGWAVLFQRPDRTMIASIQGDRSCTSRNSF